MTESQRPSRHLLLEFLIREGSAWNSLLILTHDHPDPDTIASAWALATLVERLHGIRSRLAYGGIIGRMENQMMVQLLHIPLYPVDPGDFERYRWIAIVDTQPPFQNNRLPSHRRATLVVDHHHRHANTKADLVLVDETAGATATLFAEALFASRLEIPPRLATALVYAIGSETQNLGRETGPRDVAAYRTLFPLASMQILSKIQNPPRPTSFFYTIGKAVHRAFVVRSVIGVHLGVVPSQDIVAHMADFLLSHETMRWSLVTGRYEGRLFVSLRTRNPRAEAGKLLWRLLGGGSSAGGHAMIAGGSVDVGKGSSEHNWRKTEENLTTAFLRSQGYQEPFDFQYPFQGIRNVPAAC